jgi:hypothetical protein
MILLSLVHKVFPGCLLVPFRAVGCLASLVLLPVKLVIRLLAGGKRPLRMLWGLAGLVPRPLRLIAGLTLGLFRLVPRPLRMGLGVFGLTLRLASRVTTAAVGGGLVLIGLMVSLTIVGAIVGIPLAVVGFLMLFRAVT